MPRIFILGASGYLGGEALYCIKNSELGSASIACLNRNPDKAKQILDAYPDVEIISGDLDDTNLITQEAAKADVVLHLANTKHLASAKAIVAGLTAGRQASRTGTWIQISGASLYAATEIVERRFGEPSSEVYADISDAAKILHLIRTSSTRAVEQLALAQQPSEVRTALIFGPLFHGRGRGPCHVRSIQAPEIARCTLAKGHGIRLLKGQNAWSHLHVSDLGALLQQLTAAALAGNDVGWNEQGLYNPENGSMTFGELDSLVANEALVQGLIRTAELQEISAEEADGLSAHASVLWGTNAVLKGQRAAAALGWEPRGPSLKSEIADLIKTEAQKWL